MKLIKLFLIAILTCAIFSTITLAAPKNVLRYGEIIRPDTFDPYTSREMSSQRLVELMFNGLLGINEKQEIVPDLAERWEVSENHREFTFYLRKDVFWHSKSSSRISLTAHDAVFTHKLIKHPKTDTAQKQLFEHFADMRALDDHTLLIVLKDNTVANLALFQFKILPKHILKNSQFLTKKNPFANHPIGTGPYKFVRSNHNREVTLAANEDYFLGKPNIRRIVAKPFADKNIMNQALNFDALDLIVSVSPRHIAELQANTKFTLSSYNTLSYSFFAFNQNNTHLAKPAVRQALSYAINREEMLNAFFNGQGRIISGPFAPGSWAYNLDIRPDKYKPETSQKLLESAGYRKTKQGFIDQQGNRLSFKLRVPINKNDETMKRVVLAYKNYLKKIGVIVNIDFMEREAWKKAIFKKHRFDITFASWSFDDSSDISSLFHSKYQNPGQNNFISYTNKKVDQLLDFSAQTIDLEEKRSLNHQLHKIIAEDRPYTFLWSLSHYAAYNSKLGNVNIHPFKFFNQIETWTIE